MTKKKITESEHKKMNKEFPITSLCREDLLNEEVGFSRSKALRVTDSQMRRIASKLSDDYHNQLFWNSLHIIAEYVIKGK